ncbi:hypothetical protein AZE42_10254, partial [Rhizopogon vesiculosus]
MDSLWRGDENVVQGKHVLTMFPALSNNQNIDRRKSCAMEKQRRDAHRRKYSSGNDAKIKWRPDDDELKAMDSAFQPRWKEFFQDRPEKAVAIFALKAGYVGSLSSVLPPRNYMGASCTTVSLLPYPVTLVLNSAIALSR